MAVIEVEVIGVRFFHSIATRSQRTLATHDPALASLAKAGSRFWKSTPNALLGCSRCAAMTLVTLRGPWTHHNPAANLEISAWKTCVRLQPAI
jgi:hypothetical protein